MTTPLPDDAFEDFDLSGNPWDQVNPADRDWLKDLFARQSSQEIVTLGSPDAVRDWFNNLAAMTTPLVCRGAFSGGDSRRPVTVTFQRSAAGGVRVTADGLPEGWEPWTLFVVKKIACPDFDSQSLRREPPLLARGDSETAGLNHSSSKISPAGSFELKADDSNSSRKVRAEFSWIKGAGANDDNLSIRLYSELDNSPSVYVGLEVPERDCTRVYPIRLIRESGDSCWWTATVRVEPLAAGSYADMCLGRISVREYELFRSKPKLAFIATPELIDEAQKKSIPLTPTAGGFESGPIERLDIQADDTIVLATTPAPPFVKPPVERNSAAGGKRVGKPVSPPMHLATGGDIDSVLEEIYSQTIAVGSEISHQQFEVLWKALYIFVRAIVRNRLVSQGEEEDCVQVCFLTIWQRWNSLRNDEYPKAWIVSVVVHATIDYGRRVSRRTLGRIVHGSQNNGILPNSKAYREGTAYNSDAIADTEDDHQLDQLDRLIAAETSEVIEPALRQIPDIEAEAVRMKSERATYEQIAEILGLSLEQARGAVNRGKAKLIRILKEHDPRPHSP